MKKKREIINIDETLCNGCGKCVSACVEGAIQLVDGKARLVKDEYCDGLGACLGTCPTGALTIEQREAEDFDEAAVKAHVSQHATAQAAFICPGLAAQSFAQQPCAQQEPSATNTPSALSQWPIQLKLIHPRMPAFHHADLLIAADCTAFALGAFHARLLCGRKLIIACPKLDDPIGYHEKLVALFQIAEPRSVSVVRMDVPCCAGLARLVIRAAMDVGLEAPIRELLVSIQGNQVEERELTIAKLEETNP